MEKTMESATSELERKTRAYWEISRCYNGKSNKTITVERAIVTGKQILDKLNPQRPLFRIWSQLQSEIVQGTPVQASASTQSIA